MLSTPHRYNASSPFAPLNVSVTIDRYGNVYSYAAEKLWLAYGLAIGIVFIDVVFGLITMWQQGVSYTANFSTIVRAAKNADLDAETQEDDHAGKDPLPEHLAHAHFRSCACKDPEDKREEEVESTQIEQRSHGSQMNKKDNDTASISEVPGKQRFPIDGSSTIPRNAHSNTI